MELLHITNSSCYSTISCGVIKILLPSRLITGASKIDNDGKTCKKQDGEHAGCK